MLTLAGVGLTQPTPEIEDLIARRISFSQISLYRGRVWPGYGMAALSYPPSGYRRDDLIVLNKFSWPLGACRHAYGNFLCTTEQLGPIRKAAFGDNGDKANTIPLVMNSPSAVDGSTDEELNVNLYLLPPYPLFRLLQSDEGSIGGMWLLTVVDIRYYFWDVSAPVFDIKGDGTTSWTDLIGSCQTKLSSDLGKTITIDYDDPDADYLYPSTAFNLDYETIPPIIDSISYNIGMRFVANYDGTFIMRNFVNSIDDVNSDFDDNPNRSVLAGDDLYLDTI